jgi:uncharacterized protein (TIGR02588 family)
VADERKRKAGSRGTGGGTGGGVHGVESRWEWISAAVGGLLVLAAITFLVYEAVAREGTPPAIVVRVDSVSARGDGHLVELRVFNRGGTTAAAVLIEGELKDGERSVETAETTIDYIPARGFRRAGLYFGEDPRKHRLEVRPKGFDLP